MSGMLDNKNQIIHIACEVVVLFGIVYYVNHKNKKLLRTIESLAQRIEDQDDLIVRLEDLIKAQTSQILQVQAVVSKLASEQFLPPKQDIKVVPREDTKTNKKNVTFKNTTKAKPKLNEETKIKSKPVVVEKEDVKEDVEEDVEEDVKEDVEEEENDDKDVMDEEISTELQELEDSLNDTNEQDDTDKTKNEEKIEELDITDDDLKKKDL